MSLVRSWTGAVAVKSYYWVDPSLLQVVLSLFFSSAVESCYGKTKALFVGYRNVMEKLFDE